MYPKKGAYFVMIDVIALNGSLGKTSHAKIKEEKTKSSDHCNKPEVVRSEKSSQYGGPDHLNTKVRSLGKDSN